MTQPTAFPTGTILGYPRIVPVGTAVGGVMRLSSRWW